MRVGLSRFYKTSDARRASVEGVVGVRPRTRRSLGIPICISVGFCALAFLVVFAGQERLSYFIGQYLGQPVFSRVQFERVNQSRTAEMRKQAQQEVPNYFRLNSSLLETIEAEFRDLLAAVNAAETFEQYSANPQSRWVLDEPAFDALNRLTDEAGSAHFAREADKVIQKLSEQDMVERADLARETRSTASYVELDRGNGEFVRVPKERLIYAVNTEHIDRVATRATGRAFVPEIRPVLVSIIKRSISPAPDQYHPIYAFDQDHTRQQIEVAGRLEPVKDTYQVGDRLVSPGELDGERLALLTAELDAYLNQRKHDPVLRQLWIKETLGLFGLIVLISAGLAVFTYHCQPRVAENPTRALGLASLILIMLLADRLLLLGIGTSPIWSVVTIAMTVAILTIAYSQNFAIGATAVLSLLTVQATDSDFAMFLIHMTVAVVASLLLQDIRTRLKMVEVGGITALAAAVSTIFVGLSYQQSPGTIITQAAFAALAAMAGISMVLVLLPLIEKAFRITTSLTLLEWADTSNPLLRHLIEKAPGTWQHSHLLGSMAESAAEEIGANGLMVRVGAYYHDIGKTCKPQYFVENQSGKLSAHQRLAPTMSLLVILAHVKDGVAMAKEHGLPRVLHQFIAEHHGTTIVRYFHAMAAQEARASGRNEREVSEMEFRYPGPKPRTRESAILMLCDGVEGAVRALSEPTPSRIESVVHEIFMQRLMDGQFDDCEITLKELFKVEQNLVKSLCAFHHGRIAYPKTGERAPDTGSAVQARTA